MENGIAATSRWILGLALICAVASGRGALAAKWWVATTGDDVLGQGQRLAPYRTLQRAIDQARDGDEVIVLEDRHAGPGNVDLDFRGKAVTVRSRDPESDDCLRATILDAEGRGVIVRFAHDEGPGSVLAGFTLVPGDAARPVPGMPGVFELSRRARPTLERLRIADAGGFDFDDVKVEFYVEESGWTLVGYSPDLVLGRGEVPGAAPDNRPDLWAPRPVPGSPGQILFERSRADLTRTTDIHLAALPWEDPPEGSPLVRSTQYSRLLDVRRAADGTVHLLWTGKPGDVPGVFHGRLEPEAGRVVDAPRSTASCGRQPPPSTPATAPPARAWPGAPATGSTRCGSGRPAAGWCRSGAASPAAAGTTPGSSRRPRTPTPGTRRSRSSKTAGWRSPGRRARRHGWRSRP